MTKPERDDLARLVRQRAKLAKTAAAQRAAELRSEFEQQLDRRYAYDQDAVWDEAYTDAERLVAEAQIVIAKRSAELGIPAQFAPDIHLGWSDRGRNSSKAERTELRRIAHAAIEAAEKRARTSIEAASVELQTELVAGSLSSEGAKAFLERMPSIPALMPGLQVQQIEALLTRKGSSE